ncbi:TPA: hypothetical protein ACJ51G_000661 [Aeromonas hydrophila subsp. hydrophila]|uniref:DUF7415 domain-containing protein n=1 Tax=Aeromonas hydrophila TaxID=644 RepID=UPI001BFCE7AE|nr:hypothetical protein [Aeromonas hydrophila]
MKCINWNQASELGLIVRINREILHPLGLSMSRDPKGQKHSFVVFGIQAPEADSSKPSMQHIEMLAAALVAQAQELRDCGPAEWSSFSDMVEGALNNIRVDVGVLRD